MNKRKSPVMQSREEFHIPMEDEMGRELNQMCNLSDLVEEKGREGLLTEQIQKKLIKGKSISMIADELEVDESVVRKFVEKMQKKSV